MRARTKKNFCDFDQIENPGCIVSPGVRTWGPCAAKLPVNWMEHEFDLRAGSMQVTLRDPKTDSTMNPKAEEMRLWLRCCV